MQHVAVAQIINSLSMFIMNLVVVRLVNLEDYGKFSLVLTLSILSSVLMSAFTSQLMLAKREYKSSVYVISHMIICSGLTLLALMACTLLMVLGGSEAAEFLFYYILVFVGYSVRDLARKVYMSKFQGVELLFNDILYFLTLFGILYALFLSIDNISVETLLLAFFGANFLTSLPLLKIVLLRHVEFDSEMFYALIRQGRWLIGATLVGLIGIPLTPVVLSILSGSAELIGVYKGVFSVLGLSSVLIQFYEGWLQPKIRDSREGKLLLKFQMFNIFLSVLLGGALMFIYLPLFEFLYGSDFVSSAYFSGNLVLCIYVTCVLMVLAVVEKIKVRVFGDLSNLFAGAIFSASLMYAGVFLAWILNDPIFYLWSQVLGLLGLILYTKVGKGHA